ncbi:lectin-like domain-containing protein [Lactococcus taiwanensis]|uniref:lectin-like domain-containing protein n=1 Tax=Lactococcus taiwanensis TaxID=1151742 RepID=UPI0023F3222E|nr:MucBP domain-containing protein [Lactococcus taiwanensis]
MKKKSILLTIGTVSLLSGGGILVNQSPTPLWGTKVYAATTREVTVLPTNFLEYFQRNGSAANFAYDTTTYTQTLTSNTVNQSGNVTLKTKIDMAEDFSFTGLVNLGDKSSAQGGADGIGFLFHPGNTNDVGSTGAGLGIASLTGAFGFKLDTYYNGTPSSGALADPQQYANGQSFGAFVDGTTGTAVTQSAGSQAIAQPTNNTFIPFTIKYTGATKMMTVTYNNQTWSRNVSDWIGNNTSMSFAIAASTGAYRNLQQLRNIVFSYTVAQGTVTANYVDEAGNPIADPITTNGDIATAYTTQQQEIPGYTFKEVTGASTTGSYTPNDQVVNYVYTRNQGTIDVTYYDDVTGQILSTKPLSGNTNDPANYSTADTIQSYLNQGYELVSDNYPADAHFTDDPQHFEVHLTHEKVQTTEQKEVNETIHYVIEDNAVTAPVDYVATPITFSRSVTTDKVTGQATYGAWQADGATSFAAVNSPTVTGYTPDSKVIAEISNITADTADIVKTVTYKRNQGTITVNYFDDVTGERLTTKELTGGTGDSVDYTTAETIQSYLEQNYEKVSDAYTAAGDVKFTDTPQVFEVHLTHATDSTTEQKVVNEKIHYVYDDGSPAATDYEALPISFTRTVTTDKVTGQLTYGAWQADNGTSFSAVSSPKITGYTPSQQVISEITGITADTPNIEKIVVYRKNPPIIVPPVIPDIPITPQFPDQPEVPTLPQIPTVPQLPDLPNIPGRPSVPVSSTSTSSTEIRKEYPTVKISQTQHASTTPVTSKSVTKEQLPSTGESSRYRLLSILGGMIVLVGALLLILNRRKKQ